jgi:catechol 2,3-dioxygenase-like lactoylglutathione lyase family enzyme
MSFLQVQQIDHVTIIVSDLDATHRFYVEVLGMSEAVRPAFDFPGRWFQAGNTWIHATLQSPEAGLAGWGDRKVTSVSRGHHFAFTVPDALLAARQLAQVGVPIIAGPKTRPDGAMQFYLADPDGHVVEITSPAPQNSTSV